MILYSPAKINIGLHILKKRDDAFHDLSSLMYPIPFTDMIEIHADFNSDKKLTFTHSGIMIPGPEDSNLCQKAVQLFLKETGNSAEVKLHLHKQIPIGAGLGGGSSNASKILLAMNKLAGTPLNKIQLLDLAAQLGSDCPLFIYDKPLMASGRGEILEETMVDLKGYYLVLLNPGIAIHTAEAYSKVLPNNNRTPLSEALNAPIMEWRNSISNDFEASIFSKHPQIEQLKRSLYDAGAIYASMSGSGSSVYGIYNEQPTISGEVNKLVIWKGLL